MSSPTTGVRRYGAAKTYSRNRENTAARSFDEMLAGKPAPIKASPAHTKWGRTNFVAIRDDKKLKLEGDLEGSVKTEQDPFSFDTEDKRKPSPSKRVVVASNPEPSASRSSTRLPASRIMTQGKNAAAAGQASTAAERTDPSPPQAIARPGRTYTRSTEGRVNSSGPPQQLIMDQFVEVGKTIKTNMGMEVVYSIDPHVPAAARQAPRMVAQEYDFEEPIPKPTPKPVVRKPRAEPVAPKEPSPVKRKNIWFDDPDDEKEESDDDIFPVFKRTPLKTYTGEIITPISDVPDDPPNKRRKKGPTGKPPGRKSCYSDPSLIEEYRKRYEETHGIKDSMAGMNNSTVVSSKELRGNQGTTLVVVCKPKLEVPEKKEDVQTKYFRNVKKELGKSDKNLEGAEQSSQDDAASGSSTPSVSPVSTNLKKSPAVSVESGSTASTPTKMKVRFADESDSSSPATTVSYNSPVKRTTRGSSILKDKVKEKTITVTISSSTESISSSSTNTSQSSEPVATRKSLRSGGEKKQYRIFKSRGPPQKEAVKEAENFAGSDSPPMPELTPESVTEDSMEVDDQTPPNITELEEQNTRISLCDSEATTVDMCDSQATTMERTTPQSSSNVPVRLVDSLTSVESISSATGEETTDDSMLTSQESTQERLSLESSQERLSLESSQERLSQESSQERLSDSRDTPSPAASDDSQEIGQDDSIPSAPRRFFKSKKSASTKTNLQRKVFEKSPSKASYNARSWNWDESGDKEPGTPAPAAKEVKKVIPFSDDDEPAPVASKEPRITRTVNWSRDKDHDSFTSVKVRKEHKQLYTVVHNVKMAHEMQESGETQDFMEDVDYLMENLKDRKPTSIRALSTIQLAGKCTMPAFRMHLRAHGTVTKIFSLLHDACSDSSLALSTASMMFMLSRDRLNMDLDKESLHLMLKLNEVDIPRQNGEEADANMSVEAAEESSELGKCRTKVKELLDKLQKETNAKEIDLDFVSTGNLAMESLLSLTSRRAGEWFKEELRQLGGLDHFVETIDRCMSTMKGDLSTNFDTYMPSLKKLDRCLRVLENITFMNPDNQSYLINYNKGLLISATGRMLEQCAHCLPVMPLQEKDNEEELKAQPGWIVFDCLLAILRVMLNITHDSELGCTRFSQEESLMQIVLHCVVNTQWCVPPDQRFDLLVLSLGLLVNLMEHCPANREQLVASTVLAQATEVSSPVEMPAVKALVQLFLQRENAARQMEEAPESPTKGAHDSPNKSGEWRESDSGIEWIAKSAEKVKAADKEQRQAQASTASGDQGAKKSGEEGDKTILEDEETFTKALHKAGKHMENSIIASYVGLLLGCLIQSNKEYVETVKGYLPDGDFEPMIKILKKFLGFMSLTTAIGTTDANSLQRVIDTLETC